MRGYMNLEDATVSMMYMDRTGMELYKVKLKEGQLPQKENDIVVSKRNTGSIRTEWENR